MVWSVNAHRLTALHILSEDHLPFSSVPSYLRCYASHTVDVQKIRSTCIQSAVELGECSGCGRTWLDVRRCEAVLSALAAVRGVDVANAVAIHMWRPRIPLKQAGNAHTWRLEMLRSERKATSLDDEHWWMIHLTPSYLRITGIQIRRYHYQMDVLFEVSVHSAVALVKLKLSDIKAFKINR
jgi:hypothetical protein